MRNSDDAASAAPEPRHYYGIEDNLDHIDSPCQAHLHTCSRIQAVALIVVFVTIYVFVILGAIRNSIAGLYCLTFAFCVAAGCFWTLICVLSAGQYTSAACHGRLLFWMPVGSLFYLALAWIYWRLFSLYTPDAADLIVIVLLVVISVSVAGLSFVLCVCYRRVREEKLERLYGPREKKPRSRKTLVTRFTAALMAPKGQLGRPQPKRYETRLLEA
jgi:hypothetical protein